MQGFGWILSGILRKVEVSAYVGSMQYRKGLKDARGFLNLYALRPKPYASKKNQNLNPDTWTLNSATQTDRRKVNVSP